MSTISLFIVLGPLVLCMKFHAELFETTTLVLVEQSLPSMCELSVYIIYCVLCYQSTGTESDGTHGWMSVWSEFEKTVCTLDIYTCVLKLYSTKHEMHQNVAAFPRKKFKHFPSRGRRHPFSKSIFSVPSTSHTPRKEILAKRCGIIMYVTFTQCLI